MRTAYAIRSGPLNLDADTRLVQTAAEPGRYDAFLSYSPEDREFVVDRLRAVFLERGMEVWVDVEDIVGGAKWRERVQRGTEAWKAFE